MRGVGGLLNLCQGGTCICDHQQNNVLYCYGEVSRQCHAVIKVKYISFDEVVLKKPHLRDGDTSPPSLLEHLYPVQLAQLVTIIFILLLLMILVLTLTFLFIIYYSLHQGNGHPSVALHVTHPALHPIHPCLPQAPGQDSTLVC